MLQNSTLTGYVVLALLTALVVSFLLTPAVKSFAYKVGAVDFRVGAVDVPKNKKRMHDHPIPRMGGLAIFFGFLLSVLVFLPLTLPLRGMLLGAVVIVILGVVDDITPLPAKLKFVVQILAAILPVSHGVVIRAISNPNLFSPNPYWQMGNVVSVVITDL